MKTEPEHGMRFEARIDRQSEEQLIVRFYAAGNYSRFLERK